MPPPAKARTWQAGLPEREAKLAKPARCGWAERYWHFSVTKEWAYFQVASVFAKETMMLNVVMGNAI
jgi:hypothetical protein